MIIGEITIQSYPLGTIAYIHLKTDNFTFYIQSALTLKFIVFSGFDMHMSKYPCSWTSHCCYPNTNSLLYDQSHICSLATNQGSINYDGIVYKGFIQLGGNDETSLIIQDVSVYFFNSFEKHVNFIWSSAPLANIIINHMDIDQIYLPGQFILNELTSEVAIIITNFQMSRYNEIETAVLDSRAASTDYNFLSLKNARGTVTFDYVFLDIGLVFHISRFTGSFLTVLISNLEVKYYYNGPYFWLNYEPVSIILSSNSQTNITITYMTSYFSSQNILSTDSNTNLNLYHGLFHDIKCLLKGSNNKISLNSVTSNRTTAEVFLFEEFSFNNSVELMNSVLMSCDYAMVYFFSLENSVYFFNTTILGLTSYLSANFYTAKGRINQLFLEKTAICNYFDMKSVILTWGSFNITVLDSQFRDFSMISGGLILVFGEDVTIFFENCFFINVTSELSGAIYSSFGGKNNLLNIQNCSFSKIESHYSSNIMLESMNLTINNSVFCELISPTGNFIFSVSSKISVNNCSLQASNTSTTGLILLFSSEISIRNSNYSSVFGNTGAFSQAFDSNFSLSNSQFVDFYAKSSFFYLENNCKLFVRNCDFSKITGKSFLFSDKFNDIRFSHTVFCDIIFFEGGLFQVKTSNKLYFENINITFASSEAQGALVYAFEKNEVMASDLIALNITSKSNALFYLFQESSLLISNSSFMYCSSEGEGGIVYSQLGFIQIEGCSFLGISAQAGGILYVLGSDVVLKDVTVQNTTADIFASVIYAENSSLSVKSANFTGNALKNALLQLGYSLIYVKNKENNGIILENVVFQKDGINSNFFIFVKGGSFVKFNQVSFIENSQGLSLIELIDVTVEIKLMIFAKNSIESLIIIKESSNETINIEGMTIEDNVFESDLIVIKLQSIAILRNIVFFSNKINSAHGEFFDIYDSKLLVFENFTVFENLKEAEIYKDVYFVKFSDCASILFTDVNMTDNFFIALNSSNSSIKLKNFQSFRNKNSVFITASFSNLSIEDSRFEGHNNFSVYNDVSSELVLIKLKNSNLQLRNTNFLNNQVFSEKIYSQYELLLINGSSLEIQDCIFRNDYSFSLKTDSIDSITINGSVFERTDSDRNSNSLQCGGVYVTNTSQLNIEKSSFFRIGSITSFSALYAENYNSQVKISIKNTNFSQNSASQGGAIYLLGLTTTILHRNLFESNTAVFESGKPNSGLGGVIFSQCLNYDCYLEIADTIFRDNSADFLGGSIFLENYKISKIENTTFLNDTAKFADFENSIVESPHEINLTKMVDERNETSFFSFGDQDKILEINSAQAINLFFSLFTFSKSKCDYESNSSVFISENHPTGLKPLIFTKGSTAFTQKGDFEFSNFIVMGEVNRTYELLIELKGRFTISRAFFIKIRFCQTGEYYDEIQDTCLLCPMGSYSLKNPVQILSTAGGFLQNNISICEPCLLNAMCQGSKINPDANYWISENTNSTRIVRCPLLSCLYQDVNNFKHQVPCAVGFKGPLCVKCEEGYAKDSFTSKCLKCQASPQYYGVFIGKIVFMLFFVSYQIHVKLFRESSRTSTTNGVLVKIIRDHFNQIFMLFTISSFLKFDSGITIAHENLNNIVSGVTLNINCFVQEEEFELIYFMIFNTVISPLYLIFFISLAFLLFFFIKLSMKKTVFFRFYLKTLLPAFIVICDTQYAQILVAFFKLFDCTTLDSDSADTYLKFSPNILCFSDGHLYYIKVLGVPALILWILGLPLIYFVGLTYLQRKYYWRNRLGKMAFPIENECKTENKSEDTQKKSLGAFEIDIEAKTLMFFFSIDYKEKTYYWSCFIMIWKFVLAVLVSFIEGEHVFISLYIFYLVLIMVYTVAKPYKFQHCSSLVILSLFCNLCTVVILEYAQNVVNYNYSVIVAYFLVQSLFLLAGLRYLLINFDYKEANVKIVQVLKKIRQNQTVKTLIFFLESKTGDEVNRDEDKNEVPNAQFENILLTSPTKNASKNCAKFKGGELILNIPEEIELEDFDSEKNAEEDEKDRSCKEIGGEVITPEKSEKELMESTQREIQDENKN